MNVAVCSFLAITVYWTAAVDFFFLFFFLLHLCLWYGMGEVMSVFLGDTDVIHLLWFFLV